MLIEIESILSSKDKVDEGRSRFSWMKRKLYVRTFALNIMVGKMSDIPNLL